jgi:chromosome segregation ATPase
MSQPCAIADCKRTSRALCHCCQQDLCREHLNEHDDFLNEQLNPFADEINQLSDQINHIDVKSLRDRFREQLNEYRNESYRKIDRYVDEKQRQLDEFINKKLNNQIESINHVKTIIKHLIDNQDTTAKDLNSISSSIQSIRREISQFEYKSIVLNINPLEISNEI